MTGLSAPSPIPHRKVLRSWLLQCAGRETSYALTLLITDLTLFSLAIAGVVRLDGIGAKLLSSLAGGFLIGRLFILGHDACHQSFTPHRRLNRWLGRLAFLPSLTPFSLWDVGHNVVHHGYTNLKGVDFVWAPATPAEFGRMTALRQQLERCYRSGWGCGLYYLIEIWWKRMFFPAPEHLAARRPVFLYDNLLISAGAVVWLGGLAWAAHATRQSLLLLEGLGFVLPFLFWNTMIGFVVYVHHTHTAVRWHDDKRVWAADVPFVSTTVHLTFPRPLGALLHHIMEHTAHHVDMGIPLYHLAAAQQILEARLPGRIVVQPFSWHWYFATARRCKLYDFRRDCWTDFAGQPQLLA